MFLSWIFPHYCIICQQRSDSETAICSHCLEEIERLPRPLCLYCGAPVEGHHQYPDRCDECEGKTRPFAFARSAIPRTEVNMELIYRLKFCKEIYIARACAPLLAELWEQHRMLADIKDWVVVPVPVSRKRLQERRYNQARELAAALCKLRPDLRMLDMLRRLPSSVHSQAGLSAGQRMAHARTVYRVKKSYASGRKKAPQNIILLDDVYTTGSTVRACARLLRNLPEVKKVAVITLLRVPKR